MLLHVRHETLYHYTPAVENAQHAVHLRPGNSLGQTILQHALHISPQPAQRREVMDAYGNSKLFFSLQNSHDALQVIADSVVQTQPRPVRNRHNTHTEALAWESVREAFRYRSGAGYNSAWEFVFASPYVPRHEAFADFAKPSFTAGRSLLEAADELMSRIHSAMTYDAKSTDVDTPALVALQQGKGVCQDFAHIMVACCRAMGLPARYVSGYMLTQPAPGQPRLIGCDASHAWASVYCPNTSNAKTATATGQWFDFDPTNNRAPGEDYVTLAIGRDFLDVSPLRGVIRGGAQHTLDVAVTVTPMLSAASI
jgi:transglutaminase-like putative cysteine protease